ncbi:hypothetical protein [Vibrio sp. 1CM23M]|uniref:hypothetical protein n=1 Tax=Vibrio sp. 1CM23M TaxID=2929164 RepID=UPI0020BF8D01|nr:hypothetical protein [Vibrio sp. 1CM23M]MCK8072445.1 hypothetical protein [Vibrio sp. 1CM23M]
MSKQLGKYNFDTNLVKIRSNHVESIEKMVDIILQEAFNSLCIEKGEDNQEDNQENNQEIFSYYGAIKISSAEIAERTADLRANIVEHAAHYGIEICSLEQLIYNKLKSQLITEIRYMQSLTNNF